MLAGLAAASMDEAERSTEVSMEELSELVDTAGGEVAAGGLQQRQTPDPRSFLGEGKVAELKEIVANSDCDLAVFDNELSPSQLRVLSEELGVKVLAQRSGLPGLRFCHASRFLVTGEDKATVLAACRQVLQSAGRLNG